MDTRTVSRIRLIRLSRQEAQKESAAAVQDAVAKQGMLFMAVVRFMFVAPFGMMFILYSCKGKKSRSFFGFF